jgi:hypothetical protein
LEFFADRKLFSHRMTRAFVDNSGVLYIVREGPFLSHPIVKITCSSESH